ncbi:hypothetical protein BZL30_6033 [Mycobacterium kansasii]|uniref:Uncharacterized protein n=1 Tax=Mycobacterium kansasii TaxID=1768 RepID=A0A1V3WT99_MYCKA|nr:hypothetical protein BZL30_6033 [Mycobacterium kansasii]
MRGEPATDEQHPRLAQAEPHRRGPSTHSPRWSWWRTGPSMTALVMIGIPTVATRLAVAATTMTIQRVR